ncbi:MAG: hypothetical protein NTX52_00825 [Planctomycetota bacterium]|nr:hypothetical protein [Planctomycetota bacterium]
MKTQNSKLKTKNCRSGSMLALVIIAMVLLTVMGLGLLSVAYGVRLDANRLKNETVSRLSAEAGYEQALYWMSQQQDILSALQKGVAGTTGTLTFPDGDCDYQIRLFSFVGSHPVYRVISTGHSGAFTRTADVLVLQAVSGWDMGQCRVASGKSSTQEVYFANGEIIDIPLHINNLKKEPERDIYIMGSPRFLQLTGMGESQYAGKTDKYASVMGLFEGGIDFDQPDSKITDETAIQGKLDRFKDSTKPQFKLTPAATASTITNPQKAVQLEFFVDGGVGKVRITNNCTVRGFQQSSNDTWDWRITPGSGGTQYEKYDIYAYHVMPTDADNTGERIVRRIDETYVTQTIGGVTSEPGGQIYVEGNVIIGSSDTTLPYQNTVNGKITVVATGNIWIADNIGVSDYDDSGVHYPRSSNNMPAADNPNTLGLVAQGVVKVADPGMSDYGYVDDTPIVPSGFTYVPIGIPDNPLSKEGDSDYHKRHLADPTVVEAAMTVGGGGWGAENVARGSNPGRKEASGNQDDLIVRGTITESLRGVVGVVGSDGYLKHYYLDWRLLEGILPGDIWLRGKYVPAPAGWHDYRASN